MGSYLKIGILGNVKLGCSAGVRQAGGNCRHLSPKGGVTCFDLPLGVSLRCRLSY